ncbi:MAG: uroporphyrinogen decarboxylase family protein [Clostridiaceae bacterium]|nr:uroporphyrinogen decarboxylase family protein [Clostridiaceae bacterium]
MRYPTAAAILSDAIANQARIEAAKQAQEAIWRKKPGARPPLLLSVRTETELPTYTTKQTHYDAEKMLISQLPGFASAVRGSGCAPSVRANMGCGIYATLLGVRQELYDDKMPWVQERLPRETIEKLEPGQLRVPDDSATEFGAGLAAMRYMAKAIEGTGGMVYPLDLQSPFSLAHLCYGDDIFYEVYDDPEFVAHLCELTLEAVVLGFDACLAVSPESERYVAHYNNLVIPRDMGGVKLSEDTSTLLSDPLLREFTEPYMNRLFERFGGGYVHYCGQNAHLYDMVLRTPKAWGLNFGNPEMHDMPKVLSDLAKANKIYYGGLPMVNPSAPYADFERYLRASYRDGVFHLLLTFHCDEENRERVLEDWERAIDAVLE